MSDSETPGPSHPTHGGKSLQSLERPRYKSWRKKYRKMRHHFDGVLEDNKRLFREEQKLEGIAKRLREELDGLLELCLDLNQNPSLSPDLRYELSYPAQPSTAKFIEPRITPAEANKHFAEYRDAVKQGMIPNVDLEVARTRIEERLAAQETKPLPDLESSIPHPVSEDKDEPEEDDQGPGYMIYDQENEYLDRLDFKLTRDPMHMAPAPKKQPDPTNPTEEKNWAELTPREAERQVELLNPQSQHNWLKSHTDVLKTLENDNESLASEAPKTSRKRGGKDKNLAKQVGDKSVERAREGYSPSGMSDEEVGGGAGRKRGRDPDGSYRVKSGKTGKGGSAKRKRSGGEEMVGGKRRRVDGEDADDEDGGYGAV